MAKYNAATGKVERTPEEVAEIQGIRERFKREQPSKEELIASGDLDPAEEMPLSEYLGLHELLAAMHQERERQGLSLNDMAERCGVDRATLSKLANGKLLNPTLATLQKYASALGKRLNLSLVDAGEAGRS